jgi:hypothetical protein
MLIQLITASEESERDRSLFDACSELSDQALLGECEALDSFWRQSENLYERVRALMLLYALHRFILPERGLCPDYDPVPEKPVAQLFARRFAHAIRELLDKGDQARRSDTYVSGLAEAYHGLALQNLADQVRHCVRSVPGNRWMFRTGHPSEIPLQIRSELVHADAHGQRPCLVERTAVRMDLSHSCWSDIFFLAMDRPEFARVLNISVDLCIRQSGAQPQPPVEAWFRVIDRPIIRLASVDLEAMAEIDNIPEIFDFGRDYSRLGGLWGRTVPGSGKAGRSGARVRTHQLRPQYTEGLPAGGLHQPHGRLHLGLHAGYGANRSDRSGPCAGRTLHAGGPFHPGRVAGRLRWRLAGLGRRLAGNQMDHRRGGRARRQ